MKKEYYTILGIDKNSSKDTIKKAYRLLALKYHPDKSRNKKTEEKFKAIAEAYAVLSDDEKRKLYDLHGYSGIEKKYSYEEIFDTADFSDLFQDIDSKSSFKDMFKRFFGIHEKEND